MARMSIDDMFLRDPRVKRLALSLGWSIYEARGRLLDVFALVYDRAKAGAGELISHTDIDIAADFEGLSDALIEHELAVVVRNGVRIRGASNRIKYLSTRETSGRNGGLKSGETRRNKAKEKSKVTFGKIEAPANPIPNPNLDPSALALLPEPGEIANSPPIEIAPNPDRDHAARFPATSRDLGLLAESVWQQVSDARLAEAAQLGIAGALPLPAITPSSRPGAFRELCARLREEASIAPVVAKAVVQKLIAQARETQSIEWLAEKSFTEGGWRTARNWQPSKVAGGVIRLAPRDDDDMPPIAPSAGGLR